MDKWEEFLEDLIPDVDDREYLQRLMGAILTRKGVEESDG